MVLKQDQNQIQKEWRQLVEERKPLQGDVYTRPEIFESWLRAIRNGVDYLSNENHFVTETDLRNRIETNKDLIEIASIQMKSIYSIMKNMDFKVALADNDGVVISTISNESIISKSTGTLALVGNHYDEYHAGTSGIGTSLFLKKPVQIWGNEHFKIETKGWNCAAAPIKDIDGEIIGCLSMTSVSLDGCVHMLALVTSAVDVIERELRLKKASENYEKLYNQFKVAIESIDEGVIILNQCDAIIQVNHKFVEMTGLESEDLVGKSIYEIMVLDNELESQIRKNEHTDLFDTKIGVQNRVVRAMVQVTPYELVSQNIVGGKLLVFRESEHMKRVATRIMGSVAHFEFVEMIGCSKELAEAVKTAKIASKSDTTVLITGESGTGKEMLAQSIHNASKRRNGPFVAINCGALPRTLVESELFGYDEGTFSGAKKGGNPGKIELADGGTLFLDEVGDMPVELQTNLLRVLQNNEIVRLGGTQPIKVDIRVIAATHQDLIRLISERRFRLDLYYRLNVMGIHIPPLRKRMDDMEPLVEYFLEKYSRANLYPTRQISFDAYEMLMKYHWPGNVRQLENTIERTILVSEEPVIGVDDLPGDVRVYSDKKSNSSETEKYNKKQRKPSVSDEVIIETLIRYKGNVLKTAQQIQISRRALYNRLSSMGISPDEYRK